MPEALLAESSEQGHTEEEKWNDEWDYEDNIKESVRQWTYEDYLKLPNDGRRYEIIEGDKCVSHVFLSSEPYPFKQKHIKEYQIKFSFW